MSDDIDSIKRQLWEKMRSKSYRDNFVAAQLSTGIAAQLITMRESRNWTQKEIGDKAGMMPARISVMENPNYDRFTLSTLKRLASAFDVALIVRFVPFSELVDWVADVSPAKLEAGSYRDDEMKSTIPAVGVVGTATISFQPSDVTSKLGRGESEVMAIGALTLGAEANTSQKTIN